MSLLQPVRIIIIIIVIIIITIIIYNFLKNIIKVTYFSK